MRKYLILLCLITISFSSCEILEDDDNVSTTNIDLSFESTYQRLYPSGTIITDETGTFSDVSVSNSTLRFYNSSNPSSFEWIVFENIAIAGKGRYTIKNSPRARAKFDAVYATDVSPDFWLNQGGNQQQGGYLEITEYENNHISGNYYLIMWHYHNQLNREVGWGISGTFKNVKVAD